MTPHKFQETLDLLSRYANLKPSASRSAKVGKLESKLVANIDCIGKTVFVLEVLRVAVRVGAGRLIKALPLLEDASWHDRIHAKLSEAEWRRSIRHIDSEMLRDAVVKGLSLTNAVIPLVEALDTREDLRDFVLEDFSARGFHFKGIGEMRFLFCTIKNASHSAEFLRSQVRHHPTEAYHLFCRAMMHQNYPFAALLRLAGALGDREIDPDDEPLPKLAAKQASQHDAIQIFNAFSSIEAAHVAHHSGEGLF